MLAARKSDNYSHHKCTNCANIIDIEHGKWIEQLNCPACGSLQKICPDSKTFKLAIFFAVLFFIIGIIAIISGSFTFHGKGGGRITLQGWAAITFGIALVSFASLILLCMWANRMNYGFIHSYPLWHNLLMLLFLSGGVVGIGLTMILHWDPVIWGLPIGSLVLVLILNLKRFARKPNLTSDFDFKPMWCYQSELTPVQLVELLPTIQTNKDSSISTLFEWKNITTHGFHLMFTYGNVGMAIHGKMSPFKTGTLIKISSPTFRGAFFALALLALVGGVMVFAMWSVIEKDPWTIMIPLAVLLFLGTLSGSIYLGIWQKGKSNLKSALSRPLCAELLVNSR